MNKNPGPGSYDPKELRHQRSAEYSMGLRNINNVKDQIPGPNSYKLPPIDVQSNYPVIKK